MFGRKRRYADEVHNWDITGDGIFLGKIIKNDKLFHINPEELSKHTIIAGSTGSGKSVAAQNICEELLKRGVEVIVFDPTGQWSGMMKPNEDKRLIRKYKKFNLKIQDNNGFPASILRLDKPAAGNIAHEAQLTIIDTSRLTVAGAEAAINAVISYYFTNAKESPSLKTVIVFEEIHRILKKFGGSGFALNDIERAVREFRKWGVGLMLISQVLEDFVGAIRANIATELQFKTGYEPDLLKIKEKFGDKISRSVVTAKPSHTLFHNSQYNIGQPFFIEIRPPMHRLEKLDKEEYERYLHIRKMLDGVKAERHAYSALYQGKYDIAESYAKGHGYYD